GVVVEGVGDGGVVQGGLGNLRLESYLFPREAIDDVRGCLKPGGVFVACNYYREGWIVARLERMLADVFGRDPLVFTLPPRDTIRTDDPFWAFTLLVAGDTGPLPPPAEAPRAPPPAPGGPAGPP